MLGGEVFAYYGDDADLSEIAGGQRKISRSSRLEFFSRARWRLDGIECNRTNHQYAHLSSWLVAFSFARAAKR